MAPYRFTIHLHGHAPGDWVEVHDDNVPFVQPLIDAGYLLPLVPADPPVPKRHRKRDE